MQGRPSRSLTSFSEAWRSVFAGPGRRWWKTGALPGLPSFFETLTAIAFLTFAEQAVDLAVLEVGMGGRLDATNVVKPLFSVITDISLDHTDWLGSTIAEIASEKAGILRSGGTMVTLPQHPEANQALGEAAVALGVRGVNAAEFIPAPAFGGREVAGLSLFVLGEQIEVAPALRGRHQQRNIALAVASAVELCNTHGYKISAANIRTGLERTVWPGRLEQRHLAGGAEVLLDIAHNPAGAWVLRAAVSEWMDRSDGTAPRVLVFGCLEDKAVEEMAGILFPVFDEVMLTRVHSPRAASLLRLQAAAERTGVRHEAYEQPVEALRAAQQRLLADGLLVVAGSVYLVGELRAQFL